ncbi:MAG: hypothetical protein QXH08_05065 [Candidatus Hadarchaeales archaeon]
MRAFDRDSREVRKAARDRAISEIVKCLRGNYGDMAVLEGHNASFTELTILLRMPVMAIFHGKPQAIRDCRMTVHVPANFPFETPTDEVNIDTFPPAFHPHVWPNGRICMGSPTEFNESNPRRVPLRERIVYAIEMLRWNEGVSDTFSDHPPANSAAAHEARERLSEIRALLQSDADLSTGVQQMSVKKGTFRGSANVSSSKRVHRGVFRAANAPSPGRSGGLRVTPRR